MERIETLCLKDECIYRHTCTKWLMIMQIGIRKHIRAVRVLGWKLLRRIRNR